MANTCFNRVVIHASKASLDALYKAITDRGEELSRALEALLPPPKGLPFDARKEVFGEFADALNGNTERDYSTEYHWRIAHYGTKAIYDSPWSLTRPDKETMILTYTTAWSPNVEYWHNLIKEYPRFLDFEITHQYHESGLGFIGEAKVDQVRINNKQTDLTIHHWQKAGAITIDDEILWDSTENVDLFNAFPL